MQGIDVNTVQCGAECSFLSCCRRHQCAEHQEVAWSRIWLQFPLLGAAGLRRGAAACEHHQLPAAVTQVGTEFF